MQQIQDGLLDALIAESGGKELGTAVRLITCGETAGEHNDLGLGDAVCKDRCGLPDILSILVAEYLGDGLGTGPLKGCSCIILAVGAGEYRNKYGRLCDLVRADGDLLILMLRSIIHRILYRCLVLVILGGEDLL